MTAPIDYALRYAALGWPVLPLAPRAKTPFDKNGYDHATTAEAVIHEWYARCPEAGIGIALAPAGLAAIDIDPRNGATATPDDYPATLTARTGGGGWHLLYRVPEGISLPGTLGRGIDVKHRGYICAEPSIHPSGPTYGWIDWDVLRDSEPTIATLPTDLGRTDARLDSPGCGDYADWLGELLDGDDVHGNALRIVGRMVQQGLNTSTIKAWFAGVACRVANERGIDRARELMSEEIDRMIAGARKKGYAPPPIPELDGDDASEDESEQQPREGISAAPIATDIWLSSLFAKRFAGRFRWSPGLDWMANQGAHWERDDTLERYSRAKDMCAQIARAKNVANDSRRTIASAKTVAAVLTLARAEPGIATPIEAWDRDPMVLNTPAGPIDLKTGRPLAVVTERDLFTQITTVAPDAGMRTPNWLRFVTEIFGCDLEMVEFVQRLAGYCLTGDRREQKLPFFYGTGANGKSVLVDEMLAIMGSYALNLPSETLMRQQHQAHPTELAQLRGKRLAVSSELEDGAYWAESRIKALTGDATLTARFMRQDHFTFEQTQKHIVVGNFKPRLKGDDPAIARRMLLVPFTEKFTGARCDPLLSQKLAAERPGILAWMIEGAVKWARDGLLIPARVRDASAEYLAANDDIALWLDDCCVLGAMHRTPNATLYASYREWKDAAGERAQSVNPWSARMAQRFKQYRDKHARGFEGVALRDLSQPTYSYADARG